VPDPGTTCPTPPPPLVKSGWPECTGLQEEQAVIFDVWPTIEIIPATALTDQYVTIKCEGLPLPRYYRLSKNDVPIYRERDWCFVLDFDDCEQWVFENKRIRNNEFDFSWATEMWYPFSYYSPDIADYLNSPVWAGKLASVLMDYTTENMQFHIGSKFLKVPILPASRYQVRVYYFDKNADAFTHDHDAALTVNVLKDPLHINMEVGTFHLPGEIVNVFVNVDVDGTAEDATTLILALYKGGTKVQDLDPKPVTTGAYVATFTCPADAGDYFIQGSASKEYETFTLYGSAITGFTVNPTLNDINAKIIALNQTVATLVTEVGNIRVDLAAVNGKVVAIDQSVVTIKTDVGTLKTNVANINGNITALHGDVVTIHTAIGELNTTLQDVKGVVTIKGDVATIKTDVETLKGKVTSIEGDVATIETNIGTITTKTNNIESNTGLQPVTIGLSLIAALAAIAAAVLILRKVYAK
jgi:prefoldin subunit 5